ncbi:carbamoyltransferase HypF [Clostridium celatum]|uniref:carbamoyltransferase HypF n=1 Tax=Clostridium celatum TaxID=36834 RepID=UPI0029103A99|nr:carbamoyltransferase HypF [Clostridium celatum]MDU3722067.1 carbamoyltransferase HypF [Clostridium celatum]MDU6295880.1 carbamoyltransferase HypF [Clostridium celatum]
MSIKRKFIEINGIVQGVGFRPFIYNLAIKNNLNGWVNNTAMGVLIDAEGDNRSLDVFINNIKNNPPPLSKINKIIVKEKKVINYKEFTIKESNNSTKPTTYISPDYSICDKCKEDIFDKKNIRYRYAFTNCTNCGPRFTITKSLPYDRDSTTMNEFIMCDNCKKEYENPLNRRFHAQPNGCKECGPRVWLSNKTGEELTLNSNYVMSEAIDFLKKGKILAVKGLGGFNLVCDGTNENTIKLLREKKGRPRKPLAIMMKDVETVKKYCILTNKEEEILTSNKRPILLLKKLPDFKLPENLAPNNKRVGVMLPYTPLHYLLFENGINVLVVTSANISGEPMIYKNEDALNKLNHIVDYYLMHNREIYMPIDDSVSIFLENKERVIRSGRGYSPTAINIKTKNEILALGAELKNTISLSNKKDIFISEYIGDLQNVSTINLLENIIEHFTKIYEIAPKTIVYDIHPDFNYKNIEIEKKIYISDSLDNTFKKIEVQHHHSHIVSCLAENNANEKVIGVAFDGTGYGLDKKIWGGEFLICNKKSFQRVAHLGYFNLPGGESAIKEPWKIAISLLYKVFNEDYEKYIPTHLRQNDYKTIKKMIDKNINSPETSSIGRLFDGISSLIGFNSNISFEGEAAIYLQNISNDSITESYTYSIKTINSLYILDFVNIIKGIIKDINNNLAVSIISKKFHNTIINATIEIILILRKDYNISSVALSGGVFQNEILFTGIIDVLEKNNFNIYTHRNIPCNDSGISFGQLIIANENL